MTDPVSVSGDNEHFYERKKIEWWLDDCESKAIGSPTVYKVPFPFRITFDSISSDEFEVPAD